MSIGFGNSAADVIGVGVLVFFFLFKIEVESDACCHFPRIQIYLFSNRSIYVYAFVLNVQESGPTAYIWAFISSSPVYSSNFFQCYFLIYIVIFFWFQIKFKCLITHALVIHTHTNKQADKIYGER